MVGRSKVASVRNSWKLDGSTSTWVGDKGGHFLKPPKKYQVMNHQLMLFEGGEILSASDGPEGQLCQNVVLSGKENYKMIFGTVHISNLLLLFCEQAY